MDGYSNYANLQIALQQAGERVNSPSSTVLFRRGERAFGLYVVLRGCVTLDLGVDTVFAHSYGPGALVGLSATLTRRNYSMTATVTEDAEFAFWTPDALEALLRERPELCQQLLVLLGERIAANHEVAKALVDHDVRPSQRLQLV